MGLLGLWRESRGTEMAKELDDLMRKINGANLAAKTACFSNILAMADEIRAAYDAATGPDRKALLKALKQNAHKVWDTGDWPSALAIGIVCLNLESIDTPGAAALQVRRETDALIAQVRALGQGRPQ